VLRKGLSPLATRISTEHSAPVIAGMRLRAGKTGSGKGAGRMVAQAITTARAAGATGKILVRGDSAYGNRAVVGACRRGKAEFSLVMTNNEVEGVLGDRRAAIALAHEQLVRRRKDPTAVLPRLLPAPGGVVAPLDAVGHRLHA
jgi:hypothetical protein